MINPITADTLYLIIPFKVSQLAVLFSDKHNVSTNKALDIIYHSDTYKKLEREATKYWHFGPVALLETLEDELKLR
jgi:hypothetical protein